jgi:hypothetical protein
MSAPKHVKGPVVLPPEPAERLYLLALSIGELAELGFCCRESPIINSMYMLAHSLLDTIEEVDDCFKFE